MFNEVARSLSLCRRTALTPSASGPMCGLRPPPPPRVFRPRACSPSQYVTPSMASPGMRSRRFFAAGSVSARSYTVRNCEAGTLQPAFFRPFRVTSPSLSLPPHFTTSAQSYARYRART